MVTVPRVTFTIELDHEDDGRWLAEVRTLPGVMRYGFADAIAQGRRPAAMQKDEEAVYNFSSELLNTKQVSDATFDAAKRAFDERGVVDLIAVIGWYNTVSMLLNTDRYPVPEGAQPELKALR
jgi:alkylhydroperoxidase family enzyme